LKFRLSFNDDPQADRRPRLGHCTRDGTFWSLFEKRSGKPSREARYPRLHASPCGEAPQRINVNCSIRVRYNDGRVLMSLFSFQGTGHAVWQRGLRILPEWQSRVKGKVNMTLTFSSKPEHAFPRGHLSGKNIPADAGTREVSSTAPRRQAVKSSHSSKEHPGNPGEREHRASSRPRQAFCTGFGATNAQGVRPFRWGDGGVSGEPSRPPQSSHLP
jgi:hypothetical protein